MLPLPILSDLQVARDDALTRLKASRHKLYRRDGRLYCARCQKRKILAKSHLWATTPCLPPTSTDTDTSQPSPHEHAVDVIIFEPDAQVHVDDMCDRPTEPQVQQRDNDSDHDKALQQCVAPRHDIDDDDCYDIDRAIDDEASLHADLDVAVTMEHGAFEEPPEDPHPTCTVSAAKRIRKQYSKDSSWITAENRAIAHRANTDSAAQGAASGIGYLLHIADTGEPTQGPPWVSAAHSSHTLYYYGGFVVCGNCGMLAQRSIARSKLRFLCTRHLSMENSLGVRRLAQCKLPRSDYTSWPDEGVDNRAGANFRRLSTAQASDAAQPQ